MYDLNSLIRRHILNFLRDKSAVFFSFLSVIILVALYFLFIGRQYTDGDLAMIDPDLKVYITAGIMMGGILIINTASLSLGMMGNLISDLTYRKLDGFLVTPVKRYKIILSYYIASIIVTAVLSLFMWLLTYLYVGIASGYWYTPKTFINTSLLIIFYTFISTSLMIFLTTMIKSINAFGGLSGVLGTFIGFTSGIYIPLFVLGKSMTYVASLIPFTHMAIVLKGVLLEKPYEILAQTIPAETMAGIKIAFGSQEIGVLGTDVSMWVIMLVVIAMAFMLLFFAYRKMNKKMGN
ncbi:MAG: ABC transporter permease [Acholeplasmataceae bacterium]|nr:ABC transporter permease [Acholeplasmataceae bacterium]